MSEREGKEALTLRELLARRASSLHREILGKEGAVPSEEIERLEQLAQFSKIYSNVARPAARWPWKPFAVLGGIVVVVGILVFVRGGTIEVELELELSEVAFSLDRQFVADTQRLLDDRVRFAVLAVHDLAEVRFSPSPGFGDSSVPTILKAVTSIRFAVAPEANEVSSINLARMELTDSTRVWIRSGEQPGDFQMTVQSPNDEVPPGFAIRVTIRGQVIVAPTGRAGWEYNSQVPREIVLLPEFGTLDLNLTVQDSAVRLTSQLNVRELTLFRLRRIEDMAGDAPSHRSVVQSGTAHFVSLNRPPHVIRAAEDIHFSQSRGEIRTLHLGKSGIKLAYLGRVGGMSTGSHGNPRKLTPTLFERIRASSLALFWGTTVSLVGLSVLALGWWRQAVQST